MSSRALACAIAAQALLAGCAHPEFDQMQAEAEARTRGLAIICADPAGCATKWARAVQWVSERAAYKIRVATDTIITTEGPLDSDSTLSAISITKVPRGDGSAEIAFRSGCANRFGCVPTHEMLLAEFADYVGRGAAPSVAQPARPALGVRFVALDAAAVAALKVPGGHGLLVAVVDAGSPAERAGLQQADVILEFGGRPMSSVPDLQQRVAATPTGSTVSVSVWRGGRQLNLDVRL